MDEMSLVWRRSRRLAGTIAVALTAVVGLLILLVSQASALLTASGAGNCGDFETAVRTARDGGTILQMSPVKDTNSIVITRDLRISGGWFPTTNCDDNNQKFTTTQAFVTHGFVYSAPNLLSDLTAGGGTILPVDLNGKRLVVENINMDGERGPGESNSQQGAGISGIVTDTSILLDNVLIHDGWSRREGGGLYLIMTRSELVMEDGHFERNRTDEENGGGHMYIDLRDQSRLVLDNMRFWRGEGNNGGGIYIVVDETSEVIVRDTTFDNNYNYLVNYDGGGAYFVVNGGRLQIENSIFINNNSSRHGGGAFIEMNGGTAEIKHTRFEANGADVGGSGLFVRSSGTENASLRLVGNTFIDNTDSGAFQTEQTGSGALQIMNLNTAVYLPNLATGGRSARITDITLDENFDYVVEFETNFVPDTSSTHVHFFFDTVPPEEAGVPGSGPWILYGGGSPFTQYSFFDRPYGAFAAEKMCVLVANAGHSVQPGTGNCYKLP